MKTWKFAALGGVLGLSVVANATFYTSEAAFKAAIYSDYYLEDFTNFTTGSPLDGSTNTWASPGANGYGWTASTLNDNLYSSDGAISTNQSYDPLTLTFTGNSVTAFGGNIFDSGIDGQPFTDTGSITLTTSNGDTQTLTLGGFLGWVSATPITSITLVGQGHVPDPNKGESAGDWAWLNHAYTGTDLALVPEPASFAVLGLGAIGLIRRRNKKA